MGKINTVKSVSICKHCKRTIPKKAKLAGFAFICPHCEKPINGFNEF